MTGIRSEHWVQLGNFKRFLNVTGFGVEEFTAWQSVFSDVAVVFDAIGCIVLVIRDLLSLSESISDTETVQCMTFKFHQFSFISFQL